MERTNSDKIRVMSIITFCISIVFVTGDWIYATVIGFEDLYSQDVSTFAIPAGYAGFDWSSHFRLMTREYAITSSGVGYTRGMIGNVVAYTSGASSTNTVEMSSETPFNFIGAYITSVWKMNQDVLVQGYYNGSLIYDVTIFTSSDRAYWFDFDFKNIDRLCIVPGDNGTDIYSTYRGNHLAIENMTIVPEPTLLLILSLGGIWAIRKR